MRHDPGTELRPEVWQRPDALNQVTEMGKDSESAVYNPSGAGDPWKLGRGQRGK